MAVKSAYSLPRLLIAAGGIYTAQSLVGGLTFLGLPSVLRSEGVGLDRIGLVSLIMLVWALKFLWSPQVEIFRLGRDGVRRSRSLILIGEAVVAVALVAFGLAGGAPFWGLLALLVLMAVASATVDIACDAFLIEQFPTERRGLANMAQVGGGYLGMIFGSGLFVVAYSMFGWITASLVLAGLVVLLNMPMAAIREPKADPMVRAEAPGILNGLRRGEIRIGLVMVVVFELGGRLAQALAGPFLIDAGLSLATLGLLNGGGGVAAGLAGTAIGGLVADRSGAVRAMFLVACAHVVTLGLLALAIVFGIGNLSILVSLFVLESALMAASFVISYARLMELVSPSQPGVDFTLFQCASAVAAGLCGFGGAVIAARAGYAATFGLAALFAAAVPGALFYFERRLKKGLSSWHAPLRSSSAQV